VVAIYSIFTQRNYDQIIHEENVLPGGFGSAVLELFERKGTRDVTVKRLGIRDEFVEHGTQQELRRLHGIDEEGIIEAVRQMMHE